MSVLACVKEGQALYLLMRLVLPNGVAVTQADVMALTAYVYDLSSETNTATVTIPFAVEDSVFDTLQTDGYWDADSDGYNVRCRVGPSTFTNGATTYRIEVEAQIYDDQDIDSPDPDVLTTIYTVPVEAIRYA